MRRHDIDWLRVLATYLLFIFHAGKVFDVRPFYHIKNAELSPLLGYLTGFIHQWHMPLFFVLAGWSVYGSLRRRGRSVFVSERLRRLFLPFLAGCVLLCPVIKYIELRVGMGVTYTGAETTAPFDERFLAFLPTFFTSLDRFSWSHLWFLIYLFTFTLLYLPLFTRLMRARIGGREITPWMVYLPVVPLALIQVTLRGYWPGFQNLVNDWANFTYYSLYFILGFLLARVPAFEQAIHRESRRAGMIAVVAVLLMIPTDQPALALVNRALSGIVGWCFVVAFLGAAVQLLAFSNAALRYLSESALPIYILHQVGIVVLGSFVIRLDAGIAAKYLLLLATSVMAVMAVYHAVVRPLPAFRLLFGMAARGRQ